MKMATNILFNHTDEIIAYVASKIEKPDDAKFEQQVKGWIIHYCEKYLHIQISPLYVNEFYEINWLAIHEIIRQNYLWQEHRKQQLKMSDYEASKRVARERVFQSAGHTPGVSAEGQGPHGARAISRPDF